MAKKTLSNRLVGMIAKIVAKNAHKEGCSINKAYHTYYLGKGKDDIEPSDAIRKYDLDEREEDIITSASKKFAEEYGEEPDISAEDIAPKKVKKVKKKVPTDYIELPDGRVGKIKAPSKLKVKGEAQFIETDKGPIVKATENTKKLHIECEDSEGVKFSDDEGGCFVEDQGFKAFEED